MPVLATNISGTSQVLPAAYGGATVVAGAQVTLSDTFVGVTATFVNAGINPTGVWALANAVAPPVAPGMTLTVWASPTGNPLVSGVDPNQPTTLAAAVALAATGLVLNVQVLAGIHAWPFQANSPIGPVGSIINLIGTYGDVGLGTLTTNAAANATSATVPTGTTLVASAHRGARIRFTSGVMAGRYLTVRDNTTSVFTLFGTTADWNFASGDSFVIERPTSIVQSPVTTAGSQHTCEGVTLMMKGIRYQPNTSGNPYFVGAGIFLLEGVWFDLASNNRTVAFTWFGPSQVQLGTRQPFLNTARIINEHGCYGQAANSGNSAALNWKEGCHVSLNNWVSNQFTMYVFDQSFLVSHGHDIVASTIQVMLSSAFHFASTCDNSATTFSTMVGSAASFWRGAIELNWGSTGYISAGSIANSVVAGIYVNGNSTLMVIAGASGTTGLVGTGNATYGVDCQGGRLMCSGTPTITGTVGNTRLGGNAAPTTWATIASGTVSDLAASTPQGVFATPIN